MQVYLNNINEGNNQVTQGSMEIKLKTTCMEGQQPAMNIGNTGVN